MRRKAKRQITQVEISTALALFLRRGGMIKQLPAQRFQPAGMVGGEKYQAYEELSDLPALAGSTEQAS